MARSRVRDTKPKDGFLLFLCIASSAIPWATKAESLPDLPHFHQHQPPPSPPRPPCAQPLEIRTGVGGVIHSPSASSLLSLSSSSLPGESCQWMIRAPEDAFILLQFLPIASVFPRSSNRSTCGDARIDVTRGKWMPTLTHLTVELLLQCFWCSDVCGMWMDGSLDMFFKSSEMIYVGVFFLNFLC